PGNHHDRANPRICGGGDLPRGGAAPACPGNRRARAPSQRASAHAGDRPGGHIRAGVPGLSRLLLALRYGRLVPRTAAPLAPRLQVWAAAADAARSSRIHTKVQTARPEAAGKDHRVPHGPSHARPYPGGNCRLLLRGARSRRVIWMEPGQRASVLLRGPGAARTGCPAHLRGLDHPCALRSAHPANSAGIHRAASDHRGYHAARGAHREISRRTDMARERSGGPSPPEEGAANSDPFRALQARRSRGDRPVGVRIPPPPPFDSPASWRARSWPSALTSGESKGVLGELLSVREGRSRLYSPPRVLERSPPADARAAQPPR